MEKYVYFIYFFSKNFSAATFCFLVPLLIEPALATLQHKFVETLCTTKSGKKFYIRSDRRGTGLIQVIKQKFCLIKVFRNNKELLCTYLSTLGTTHILETFEN